MNMDLSTITFGSCGKKKQGKTTATLKAVFEFDPCILWVFDHELKVHQALKKMFPKQDFPVAMTREELKAQVDEAHTKAENGTGGIIIFSPAILYPADFEKGFEEFCSLMEKCVIQLNDHRGDKTIPCALMVDEIQFLVSHKTPPTPVRKMLESIRHYDMSLFFTCQILADLPRNVRGQINWLKIFRHEDENTVKPLTKKGFTEEQIMNLKQFECLEKIDDDVLELIGRKSAPKKG
ncbi:MAG: hypothetical protein AAF571_14665 [Verrucomicrobiota bacterium]